MPVEVASKLQHQLASNYAGYFESGGKRVRIRVGGQCQSIEQVADIGNSLKTLWLKKILPNYKPVD